MAHGSARRAMNNSPPSEKLNVVCHVYCSWLAAPYSTLPAILFHTSIEPIYQRGIDRGDNRFQQFMQEFARLYQIRAAAYQMIEQLAGFLTTFSPNCRASFSTNCASVSPLGSNYSGRAFSLPPSFIQFSSSRRQCKAALFNHVYSI